MTCLWLVECVGGRREIVDRGLRECGVTTMRAASAILRPRRIATSMTSGQKPTTSNVTRSTPLARNRSTAAGASRRRRTVRARRPGLLRRCSTRRRSLPAHLHRQLRCLLLHPLATHRLMLRCVGADLRAVQRHIPQLHQAHPTGRNQELQVGGQVTGPSSSSPRKRSSASASGR